MKSIGFIGGGRVARIFLEGWKRKGALPEQVVVSDCNAEALSRLKSQFSSIQIAPGDLAAAASQDVVFLSVHPPVIAEAAAAIKGSLKPNAIVVSLAPKFTVAKLSEALAGFSRIARVIPNAPSIINAGFNPVAFGQALTDEDRMVVTGLLAPLGDCPEVAESKLEGYALLTAMGPTYLWFQLQALRETAMGFGLEDAEIALAMKKMVCGAARTLLDSGLTPAQTMDLVPVKPLAEMEPGVSEMYRSKLPAVYNKIKP
jgi:pyrroline-5-carboxylate reductase